MDRQVDELMGNYLPIWMNVWVDGQMNIYGYVDDR